MHSVYVDKSGPEYSIHCLTETDLDIIVHAISFAGNSLLPQTRTETQRATIRRIITIKEAIENERQHTKLQHTGKGSVSALQRRKNRRMLQRFFRAHSRARIRVKALPPVQG